jgi:hypothetical protein
LAYDPIDPGGDSRGHTGGVDERRSQPGDFGFERLDAFGVLGDEHVA